MKSFLSDHSRYKYDGYIIATITTLIKKKKKCHGTETPGWTSRTPRILHWVSLLQGTGSLCTSLNQTRHLKRFHILFPQCTERHSLLINTKQQAAGFTSSQMLKLSIWMSLIYSWDLDWVMKGSLVAWFLTDPLLEHCGAESMVLFSPALREPLTNMVDWLKWLLTGWVSHLVRGVTLLPNLLPNGVTF